MTLDQQGHHWLVLVDMVSYAVILRLHGLAITEKSSTGVCAETRVTPTNATNTRNKCRSIKATQDPFVNHAHKQHQVRFVDTYMLMTRESCHFTLLY